MGWSRTPDRGPRGVIPVGWRLSVVLTLFVGVAGCLKVAAPLTDASTLDAGAPLETDVRSRDAQTDRVMPSSERVDAGAVANRPEGGARDVRVLSLVDVALIAPLDPPWDESGLGNATFVPGSPQVTTVPGNWSDVGPGAIAMGHGPFVLPVDVSGEVSLAMDGVGRIWTTNLSLARAQGYDREEASHFVTLLDGRGAVLAQTSREGNITLLELKADRDSALVAGLAHGAVRVGDLHWSASMSEAFLLRFDAQGAIRWRLALPGLRPIPGGSYADGRTDLFAQHTDTVTVGGRRFDGPGLLRLTVDPEGAVVDAASMGVAPRRVVRATPLRSGGALLWEDVNRITSIRRISNTGEVLWVRSGLAVTARFLDDGRSFILTERALLALDDLGHTSWIVSVPRAQPPGAGSSSTLSHEGTHLHASDGLLMTEGTTRLEFASFGAGISSCTSNPPVRTTTIRWLDYAGHLVEDERRENARLGQIARAIGAGRHCTVWHTPEVGRGMQPSLSAMLACDAIANTPRCDLTGFCAPCSGDLLRDDANCGACGRACAAGVGTLTRCVNGVCLSDRCDARHADCNGRAADACEVDLRSDALHCGACENDCGAGGRCVAGRCEREGVRASTIWMSDGREGDFHPTQNTVLPAGVHQFRAVTIPAGVTVRTTAGGVLDLRAQGDVVIDGRVDLSGGPGQDSAVDAAGGSTAGAPRRAGGGAGDGPAGGGGLASRTGLGVAPGLPGPSYYGSGYCSYSTGFQSPNASRYFELPAYDGDSALEYGSCVSAGAGLHTCSVAPVRGGAGGGSIGLDAIVDLPAASTFRPGSGGGASGFSRGAGGGAGGGALRIASATRIEVRGSGAILARGGAGGAPDGGPGSGGVIVLSAPAVQIRAGATVSAAGGNVNGLGRVRITTDLSRCTLAGSFVPPVRDGCVTTHAQGFAYVSSLD